MGNFTFEGQGAYTYLVYQMDEEDQVDKLSLGMMTSNKIPGLLPVIYTQMDGQGYVKYNISSKICAKNFFAGAVNRKRLLGVFSGVAEALMSADDYMLDRNSILLDLSYIYADVTSCEASLVCVPVISTETRPVDAAMFFKQTIFSAQFDQTENCDYVTKILNYLNSTPLFSLPDFKELVDNLRREEPAKAAAVQPVPIQVVKVEEEKKTVREIPPAPVQPEEKKVPDNRREDPIAIPGLEEKVSVPETAKAKGFGLFGGKKKESGNSLFGLKAASEKKTVKEKPVKEKPVKEKKSGKEMPMAGGFSIPGMEDAAIPVTPVMEKTPVKAEETPVVRQNEQPAVRKVESYKPEQPVIEKNSHANFGDTVNLSKSAKGKTVMLPKGQKAAEVKPYLLRVSNNEQVYLTKPLFHIGQEPGYADYCIMDNPAVSHAHADISISQGNVALTDTGSTNGTYVNGQMLNANVPVYLNHGDKVVFADEEFVFYMY